MMGRNWGFFENCHKKWRQDCFLQPDRTVPWNEWNVTFTSGILFLVILFLFMRSSPKDKNNVSKTCLQAVSHGESCFNLSQVSKCYCGLVLLLPSAIAVDSQSVQSHCTLTFPPWRPPITFFLLLFSFFLLCSPHLVGLGLPTVPHSFYIPTSKTCLQSAYSLVWRTSLLKLQS